MLSAHAVLYLSREYISLCSSAHQSFDTAQHQDIGFAEYKRYYNVYAFDEPLFYQTSSNGTDQPLTSYPTFEVIQPDRNFWKPTVFILMTISIVTGGAVFIGSHIVEKLQKIRTYGRCH